MGGLVGPRRRSVSWRVVMTGVRYVASTIAVLVAILVIYFGAVLQVYVLAWILEGLGQIT
jgi:hypothetical protein